MGKLANRKGHQSRFTNDEDLEEKQRNKKQKKKRKRQHEDESGKKKRIEKKIDEKPGSKEESSSEKEIEKANGVCNLFEIENPNRVRKVRRISKQQHEEATKWGETDLKGWLIMLSTISEQKHEEAKKWGEAELKEKDAVNVTAQNALRKRHHYSSDLQNELHTHTKRYIPHELIALMYRLDLSVLCSLRKQMNEHKYPSLSLAFFEDSKIDKFRNIVLRYENKSIHIQIENLDRYYVDNEISYAKLFNKGEQQTFSINNFFNSFIKHLVPKLDSSPTIKYLIIYTNLGLDLTEDKKLRKGRSRNFYPFKFDCVEEGECDILKDFLFTNNDLKGRCFYQFSQEKTTRSELLKRLSCSTHLKELKEEFLDKLVFAVNQPNREELNRIIKSQIEKNGKVRDSYMALQGRVLCNLRASEKRAKLNNNVSGIIYEFNLLMLFLHDMFLNKNIGSINPEGKDYSVPDYLTIHYKDKIIYFKGHNASGNIGYSRLFPSRQRRENNAFSINQYFCFFIEELEKNIKCFVIYTNAALDLTEDKRLKKGQNKDFYALKFDSVDVYTKRYKILRDCSCVYYNGLYKFAQEEATRNNLFSLLKLPPALQKEKEDGRLSSEREKEIKWRFLDKLILAFNQPNDEQLNTVIRREMDRCHVPYNYEELYEIAIRWLESHKLGHITEETMKKLLEDINNNRSSYQEIHDDSFNEKTAFARSVVGKNGTPAFNRFLDFLSKGEGKQYLAVLKREGVNLVNVSGILNMSGTNAVKAFKDLYRLWFDAQGNKTKYLKTLEKERVNLSTVSSILNKARAEAPRAFKDLYDLWFDEHGNKTQYLKTLEKEKINLAKMSSVLKGAGAHASKAFKNLYDLWFDLEGNKTRHLKTLEEKRVNLANMTSILKGAGARGPTAFKGLYDLWFNKRGDLTIYLKALEKEEVNLVNMSSILSGSGASSPKAFRDLYDLWFDTEGNKSRCLKTLEENGVSLTNISGFLRKAGTGAAKAFQDLLKLWFDTDGNKTQYLKVLEQKEINLTNVSGMLGGAGVNAPKVFKELYELWFDVEGNKTKYLKSLEKEGINLSNISSILIGTGRNTPEAFRDLYHLWFDAEGNKTQYLKVLKERKISLTRVSSILGGAGFGAPRVFKDLYSLWFDAEGNEMEYLKTLKKEGVNLATMSSILHRGGASAPKAFKDLYDLWFDSRGNKTQYLTTLEKEEIRLDNLSSILNGAGANAAKAFKEFYNTFFDKQGNKSRHLKHFTQNEDEEQSFKIRSLSRILFGSGASVKSAFEQLHNVCFTDEGEITKLLDDFYKAGFRPSNLSSVLCGAGARSSSILRRLHEVCFNAEGQRSKLLSDFCRAGFRTSDLCSILSGAADSLKKFHHFCFIGETKKYLNHFLNERGGFTLINLSAILHGAGAKVCSALKDFHDVCFDEKGKETRFLDDFYTVGFRPSDLASILSMAGNNAARMLRSFHESCFNQKNYLRHFLAEKKLFTTKNVSKVLRRVGLNIGPAFEKLHDFCFDQAGRKTNNLLSLIKSNSRSEIIDILYKKVKKDKRAPSTSFTTLNVSDKKAK